VITAQQATRDSLARIEGVVSDTAGRPLADVRVTIALLGVTTRTDSLGHFTLVAIPAGARIVQLRRVGFEPADIPMQLAAGQRASIDYQLGAATAGNATALAPVVITDVKPTLSLGLQGFDARRKIGRGQFVTREEFERYAPRDVTSVLRHMHSLRVAETSDGPLVISTRGLIQRNNQPAVCAMQIGLDGHLQPSTFTIDDVAIDEIAAVEVYSGPATIPAEFNTGASGTAPSPAPRSGRSFSAETNSYCGLVMIWTRSGGR
jgi:hypothetical protein